MSDTKQRIPLALAEALAAQVVALLAPACDRIEVAGSIRRKKAEVGDLEVVVIPKLVETGGQVDLFGMQVRAAQPMNLLDTHVTGYLNDGTFTHRLDVNGRKACGERYKRLRYKGVGLDLFSVLPPAQLGVIMTIRTGCAEFSHSLVTSRLQGGWLPTGMSVKDGALWDRGAVVETPDEQSLFRAIGLPWLEPEHRTADVLPVMRPRASAWHWVRRTRAPLEVERVPA